MKRTPFYVPTFSVPRLSVPRLSVFVAAVLALNWLTGPALWAESKSFRGSDGSGVYQAEALLKSWPDGGPRQLWAAEGLGEGYASVSVAAGKIYTTGMVEQMGSVLAFDLQGKLLWKTQTGPEHSGNGFPGTRTTPTIDGETLFLLTSLGQAVALNADSGEIRWRVDLLARFKAKNIYFGISESPLVVGDKVIFTPGGENASLVALNKKTGETVWTTQGLSETSAYCSPRLYAEGGRQQIVTFVSKHLVGVDPGTGEVLWRYGSEVEYDIHATAPVFRGNLLYLTHGYNQGGMALELVEDCAGQKPDCKFSVRQKWSNKDLDVNHGGVVFTGGYVYGTSSGKTWYALDGETGKVAASIKRLGKGSVIYAEGLLYGYMESGKVLLVRADPEDFRAISSFEIKLGEGHHWAHPVISGGVLYIRHGDYLMAYSIKEES